MSQNTKQAIDLFLGSHFGKEKYAGKNSCSQRYELSHSGQTEAGCCSCTCRLTGQDYHTKSNGTFKCINYISLPYWGKEIY